MTIKLLTPRDLTIGGRTVTYPAGALVTLDAATETGLINSKEATATLTGGIAYTPPVPSGQPVPLTVTTSAQGVGGFQVGATRLSIPYIYAFPDFSPSILASFVAGTTAAQSGNTVTVTATAHGIVGSTAKDGYRIYYPGSPSIPAGWYPGFAWVDANTVTFQRAVAATVASESVNGGGAFVAQVTICSLTLPGGAMGPNGKISLCSLRSSEAAITKFLRLAIGDQVVHGISVGAVSGESRMTMRNIGSESVQRVSAAIDGAAVGTPPYIFTVPMSVDQVVNVLATVAAAGGWVSVDGCELEVVKR